MKVPAYIDLILNNKISIAGDFVHLRERLSELGFRVNEDVTQSCYICYDSTNIDIFEDIGLINTLLKLRDLGFIFGEDYKQLYSPASYMRELIRRGYKIGDFQSIGFLSVNEFTVRTNSSGLLL